MRVCPPTNAPSRWATKQFCRVEPYNKRSLYLKHCQSRVQALFYESLLHATPGEKISQGQDQAQGLREQIALVLHEVPPDTPGFYSKHVRVRRVEACYRSEMDKCALLHNSLPRVYYFLSYEYHRGGRLIIKNPSGGHVHSCTDPSIQNYVLLMSASASASYQLLRELLLKFFW